MTTFNDDNSNSPTWRSTLELAYDVYEYIMEVGRRRGLRGTYIFKRSLELLVQEHKEMSEKLAEKKDE